MEVWLLNGFILELKSGLGKAILMNSQRNSKSFLAIFLVLCFWSHAALGEESLSVYVVNYPLQYFAERIGGEEVVVHFPAPGDVDPAYWHPVDAVILEYQQADLIILNGADYAHWASHATLPEDRTIITTDGLEARLIEVEDAVTHSHGPHGTHTHAGTASITWLDPTLAVEQARAIKEALKERRPDAAPGLEERFVALEADLQRLDETLREITADASETSLLASHPVYQYLEDRYDLNLHSLHWEPDEVPTEEQWTELDEILQEHRAEWILWEDQPLPEAVRGLEERGVRSVVYNPLPQPPEEGDFLSVMRDNVESLRQVFSE